ncbi:hypothetical protein LEN26_003899 [Aphanomyces euteiches]|nr:hypothetical protein LEN26_003899 [Aphanomyces euteiches]
MSLQMILQLGGVSSSLEAEAIKFRSSHGAAIALHVVGVDSSRRDELQSLLFPPVLPRIRRGNYQCFARITGTTLCPFTNTTADCGSNASVTLPPLNPINQSRAPTMSPGALLNASFAPTVTTSTASSSKMLSPLVIALISAVSVLALLLFVAVVALFRRHRHDSEESYLQPLDTRKMRQLAMRRHQPDSISIQPVNGGGGFHHYPEFPTMTTPIMGDGVHVEDSSRALDTAYLMAATVASQPPVWRFSESSNIME